MDAKKLIEHLHQMGDDAWRDWEKMCSELCLGFEARLNSGQFNRNSLSALENASRLYGRYQAYRDAEAKIVALMDEQEPEWKVGDWFECSFAQDCRAAGPTKLTIISPEGWLNGSHLPEHCRHVPPPQQPKWEPGDSFVDGEEGNAQIRAVQNVSAGTIYATDGTRHRIAMCRHVDQPRDFFTGPAWETVEFYAKQGNAAYRCILTLRDYLLAKEKP